MSLLWIVRNQNLLFLLIVQILVSLICIYNGKNKTSYIAEITIMIAFMIYSKFSFKMLECMCYLVEYVFLKFLLLIIVWMAKRFSFYVLVCINNKKKKGYEFFIKKKRFLRVLSKVWNKVDYGIRIKKGIPSMVGRKHLATGVMFDKDGFPKFKEIARINLERKLWKKTREVHFYHASKMLYNKISKNVRLAKKFTKKEIQIFKNGDIPSKYTWHHHQDKGVLQLVEYNIHSDVRHRGGYAIWGKRE